MIAKFEDRLVREPLPLPPRVDPDAISEFDYRRVYATGRLRHDQEMLIGPRVHEGQDGYLVVTPLEREGSGTSVLVNRGWIARKFKVQRTRKEGLPTGDVTVEGLLREPWKKNMFTPDNKPEAGEFYFPDVNQMAAFTGCQPVWIEETTGKLLDGVSLMDMSKNLTRGSARSPSSIRQRIQGNPPWPTSRGQPEEQPCPIYLYMVSILRPWARHVLPSSSSQSLAHKIIRYALAAATSVMFWLVVRKPPSDIARRVRQNKEWN